MSVSETGRVAMLLSRRANAPPPACGSGKGNAQDYDTPLHVVSLLVILFVSFSACAFPVIVLKYPRLRIPSGFLFSARHFGTGVLIATAFVHLLPTAFLSLTDPCLPAFWTQDYPAMAGAISLGAVFLVTIIEMVFSPGHHGCMSVQEENVTAETHSTPAQTSPSSGPSGPDILKNSLGEKLRKFGPIQGRTTSVGRELQRMSAHVDQMDQDENRTVRDLDDTEVTTPADPPTNADEKLDDQPLSEEQKHKKALLQCMLLEMGILFHSVFIGMALSVSIGGDFIMLWVAITFHRKSLAIHYWPLPWKTSYSFYR
jgi:zinc transporter 1/2/3